MIFNIALVGSANVGKTRMLWNTGVIGDDARSPRTSFTYVPTVGVEVRPYFLEGNSVNFWDSAGTPKFMGHNFADTMKKCDIMMILHEGEPDESYIDMANSIGMPYVVVHRDAIQNQQQLNAFIRTIV